MPSKELESPETAPPFDYMDSLRLLDDEIAVLKSSKTEAEDEEIDIKIIKKTQERRLVIDSIPAGSIMTITPTKASKLGVYSRTKKRDVYKVEYGAMFEGALTKGVPPSILFLANSLDGDLCVVVEKRGYGKDYTITDIQPRQKQAEPSAK